MFKIGTYLIRYVPVKINYIRKEVLKRWVIAKANNTILAHPVTIKTVESNIFQKNSYR